jgi:hypothetical protein
VPRVLRSAEIALVIILLVIGVYGTYILLNKIPKTANCDSFLSKEVGANDLCLRPFTISISPSNSSDFVVPVLIAQPGGSASIEVLYHLSASTVNHQGNLASLTPSDVPDMLSESTGTVSPSQVTVSNGVLVYNSTAWVIYSYTLRTSSASEGYYAILPPFYYGTYPALAVASESNTLNMSALAMWGFDEVGQSSEFVIPSTIVGTSGLSVVNASVPQISYCPNSACIAVSHSLY